MTNNPTIDGVSRESIPKLIEFLSDAKAYHKSIIQRCNDLINSGESIRRDERGILDYRAEKVKQIERLEDDLRALLDAPMCAICNDTGRVHESGCDEGDCTRCLGAAPAVERKEPFTDNTFIRGWEVGSKLFRIRKEASKYIQSGQSGADGNGNKLEPLYRENHAPEVADLQSTIDQLQARIAELEGGMGEPVAWMYKREGGEVLGQLVQMESDYLKNVRLGKCYDDGTRYMWPREDYIEWKPLYTVSPAPVVVVLPTAEQFKDAFRATGYVTHEQAWELAEAAQTCLDAALLTS